MVGGQQQGAATGIGRDVPAPATDRPAAEAGYSRMYMDVFRRGMRGMCTLSVIAVVSSALLVLAVPAPRWLVVFSTLVALLLVVSTGVAFVRWTPMLSSVSAMMDSRPWRPVTVYRIFRGRRTYLVELTDVDGSRGLYRVYHNLRPWFDVAGRTGVLWMVGPDSKGRAGLRLAGIHVPLLARKRRRARRGDSQMRVSRPALDPARTAADDPVVAGYMRWARSQAWWNLVVTVLSMAVATTYMAGLVTATEAGVWLRTEAGIAPSGPAMMLAAVLVVAVASVGFWLRNVRDILMMPRLLRRGSWTRLPAGLARPYRPNRQGFAVLELAVGLPDGSIRYVVVRNARPELAEYVDATGELWLAGLPHGSGPTACGVPGYAILEVARPSPAPR
ncbi:hypothetical protein H0B56_11770 [Haloechinothrix sp. YIM 98757]|uniref:Uncharacterized protein n=1 Tax=Haloechinothrix aidingensis TaxID=2752311 RepID=A0A838AAG0_9PSEU|nr:hypothetical protein [Haloechinothrix aidingensis]MBA0126218.1 hypothetical protein [Haloechinothrix aidingensis]